MNSRVSCGADTSHTQVASASRAERCCLPYVERVEVAEGWGGEVGPAVAGRLRLGENMERISSAAYFPACAHCEIK